MTDSQPVSPPPLKRSAEMVVVDDSIADKDTRNWALFVHLSAFSGYIGIPLGTIFGPLVIWLVKREESPFIDEHGREALNFHLSMALYAIISVPLLFVGIGFLTLLAVAIVEIVFTILAAVSASEGKGYRYPLTIRFVS